VAQLLVLLDSCVIFPMPLCDTLLRAGESGLYQLYYSQDILDGATRNLIKKGRMTPDKANRFQQLIINTFPEGLVEVPAGLELVMTNHPGDRHVLAAAVSAKADVIVTANIKHFKSESLQLWNVEAITPDKFLNILCDLHGAETLYKLIQQQATDLRKPPQTFLDLIEKIQREQPLFASRLLLHSCGKMIENVARKLLYIWAKSPNPSPVQGEKYRIQSESGALKIFCQVSNREVIYVKFDEITGKIYHRDVVNFQEIAKQLVKEKMMHSYLK
jgi:predicted nucleic acid-binding protein